MSAPKNYKMADFGVNVDEIENYQGKRLFKPVTVSWSRPRLWPNDKHNVPLGPDIIGDGQLYIILRDHHRAKTKCAICYVGMTTNIKGRFYNHPVAKKLAKMRGDTSVSIGTVDPGQYRTAIKSMARTLEELEHLYIWTLWPEYNNRKTATLPGMGAHPSRAWHIINTGFRFAGQMPREITYPWIIVKPGRDRSTKANHG